MLGRVAKHAGHAGAFNHMVEVAQVLEAVVDPHQVCLGVAQKHPPADALEHSAIEPAGLDDLMELLRVEPNGLTGRIGLGKQCHIGHSDEIVDEFHAVAVAHATHMHDVGGPCLYHRPDPCEGLGIRAHECVERSRLRLHRRVAEGGVTHDDALFRQPPRQPQRRLGVGGRCIGDDHAGPCARKHPVRAEDHVLDVRRGVEAGEHDVAAPRDLGWRLHLHRAALNEVIHGGTIAVADDGEFMAFLEHVPRHAVTHEADADEADPGLGHVRHLLV